MFFCPLKFDLPLNRIPFLTILVCLVCLGIYGIQHANEQTYVKNTERFCNVERANMERMAMEKAIGSHDVMACIHLMHELSLSDEPNVLLDDYADKAEKFAGLTKEGSRQYMHKFLGDMYNSYNRVVPPYTTKALWYEPRSWNPITMLSASFSHGSWDHVIGNLFFFFAFAAAVELIIGPLAFFGVIIAMAFGTNIFYSLAMMKVADPLPTVGLSGIVMGMMTMLAYFMPTAKIRCFYWFIIKVGTVAISAWILALFFVGFDIYKLITQEEMGAVNLVAHVSGALIGLAFAAIFFRRQRRDLVFETI